MTQEVFPENHAATRELEQRFVATESENGKFKDAITQKNRLIKGWRKAINRSQPNPKEERRILVPTWRAGG